MPMSLGQSQGYLMENAYFVTYTSLYFGLTCLRSRLYQGQGLLASKRWAFD